MLSAHLQPIPATLVRPLIAVASTAFAHCSFGVPASIRHSSVPIILVWKTFRKTCRLREQVATCQIVAKEANNLSKEGDTFPNRPNCSSKYDNQRQSTQSGNHVDLLNKSESARSKTPHTCVFPSSEMQDKVFSAIRRAWPMPFVTSPTQLTAGWLRPRPGNLSNICKLLRSQPSKPKSGGEWYVELIHTS